MKLRTNYSKNLINGFLQTELSLFKNQFDEFPSPEIQDIRSLSIAWASYYFKELVTDETEKKITNFVDEVYYRENYNTHGWYIIPSLQAAAFILTGNIFYANSLLEHISCGQSWARISIIESAGLICPLLQFDNPYLRKGTERNIEYCHGMFEECTLLYISTKGSIQEKLNWLNRQIENDTGGHYKEFFEKLKNTGNYYKSDFFIRAFNKAKSYFLFKIICKPSYMEVHPGLFDNIELNFEQQCIKEKQHPLSDSYINLKFLIAEMTSKEQNEQKTNGSMKKPSKEFEEKMRLGRLKLMREQYEKRMKEYREKNQPPENQK